MNPLDASVAASEGLVAWLKLIAPEIEHLTGMSAYRLAAFPIAPAFFSAGFGNDSGESVLA